MNEIDHLDELAEDEAIRFEMPWTGGAFDHPHWVRPHGSGYPMKLVYVEAGDRWLGTIVNSRRAVLVDWLRRADSLEVLSLDQAPEPDSVVYETRKPSLDCYLTQEGRA